MYVLLCAIELLVFAIAALDTFSFINSNRKNPDKSDVNDYRNICFRWVFLLALRSFGCFSCCGTLGVYLSFILLVAKAYVTIPLLNGTEKVYNCLIQDNALAGFAKHAVEMIKSKLGKSQ